MKHLGYLKTIDLHLLQDGDGDLALSTNAIGSGALTYIAFPSTGSTHDFDAFVAEVKALTEDPTARLVRAVRAAVVAFQDEDTIEVDLHDLADALVDFDAAVEARQ